MPRKIVPFSIYSPYHLSARCINRDWFMIPLPLVWAIMEDYLFILHHGFGFEIHSFVLMPNHFHLIVTVPRGNFGEGMNYFMRETSRHISRMAGRINQTYGARVHRTQIHSELYFHHAYKYVYRNPVKAGLCRRVEDYPFSTLSGLLGRQKLCIPLLPDTLLFNPDLDLHNLHWLNQQPNVVQEEDVRRALKKTVFSLPLDRGTKLVNSLETNRL